MTILGVLESFYNAVILRIWPKQHLKRARDSDDDEEDAIVASYQALNAKRPKWMNSSYHSTHNMASDGDQQVPGASGRLNQSCRVPNKTSSRQKYQAEAKENNPDVIEIVESDCDDTTPAESRPPLTILAVRSKTKRTPPGIHLGNGSLSLRQERKPNGLIGRLNTFTVPLNISRITTPKITALDETFKLDERLKYSQLLTEYHRSASKSAASISISQPGSHMSSNGWPSLTSSSRSTSTPKSIGVIDLTGEEKRKTRIEVTPWSGGRRASADESVQLLETRPRPHVESVNTLQKRLAENSIVSPLWISQLQEKYNERTREKQRQLEEAKIKKELYAKHNLAKHEAALNERIKRHLKITDVVVLDDTEEAALPELTSEMMEKINWALKPHPPGDVLVEGFGQRITRNDIQTLNKLNWLNDEVINFYMNLLIERGKEEKNMKVYAFNTFFYPKLVSQGYSSLKRWTKKVDIFAHELLLVPVHLGMHWCMATIDFRDQTVRYYDSMGSENNRCLNALLRYLTEESMDKKKKPYDISGWKMNNIKDIPQQMNGSDCGMFSCMFAEFLSRNANITFSQKDMPYFRRKMVYEIITKKLLQ